MTAFRTVAGCLALGLLLGLAGCTAQPGQQKGDGKENKDKDKGGKTDPPTLAIPSPTSPKTTPGTNPTPGGPAVTPPSTPPQPTGPIAVKLNDPAQKAAEAVLGDLLQGKLLQGKLPPERISARFLKVIARPNPEYPEDVKQGFSAVAARNWAHRAAMALGQNGLPAGIAAPGVAVFTGSLVPKEKGQFLLRIIEDGGAWKLDWFQVSGVQAEELKPTGTIDQLLQEFAAVAFLDAIADRKGTNPDDRVLLVASLISPAYRSTLGANPTASDTKQGYDYNPGWLKLKLGDLPGGAAVSYTRAAAGAAEPNTIRGEFTLTGGAKKPYTLKLVKDPTRHEWLVDAFTLP